MAGEIPRVNGRLHLAAAVALLLALTACAAPRPATNPARAAASEAVADPSYNWHVLVLVPFGTLLRASGLALHEVLLFHDAAEANAGADHEDCYGVESPPRFLGRTPEAYALCFDHDRLQRIDAAVHLGIEESAGIFARACAQWLKDSVPMAGSNERCEGRDKGIAFNGRLRDAGESAVLLSMTLSAVPDGDAGAGP